MPTFQFFPMKITGANRQVAFRATQMREMTVKGKASPKFSAALTEARCAGDYQIQWDSNNVNINQAFLDFIGYSEAVIPQGGGQITINRHIPYPHPSMPNYLYADSIQQIEGDVPLGIDVNAVAIYSEAMMNVNFSTRKYVIADSGIANESLLQQYVTIHAETTSRYETIPDPGALIWCDQLPQAQAGFNALIPTVPIPPPIVDRTVTNKVAIVFCEGEVFVTWHQVPVEAIPWNAMSACVGHYDGNILNGGFINRFPFMSNTYIGPVFQQVPRLIPVFLCLTPKIGEPYPMVNGGFACDIMYKFKFYPFGVNSFYRWRTGRFELAALATGGFFFKPANFNTLFLGT